MTAACVLPSAPGRDLTAAEKAALVAEINSMDLEQLARRYRFGEVGDPMFVGDVYTVFRDRFESLGGWTPELSNRIGWEK